MLPALSTVRQSLHSLAVIRVGSTNGGQAANSGIPRLAYDICPPSARTGPGAPGPVRAEGGHMSYANRGIPLFAAWPPFVDPTRMTARLWRLWRTVDNAGNIRRHEGVDETSSLQADGTFAFQ